MNQAPKLVIAPIHADQHYDSAIRQSISFEDLIQSRHPQLFQDSMRPWSEFSSMDASDRNWLILIDAHADFGALCIFFESLCKFAQKPGSWTAGIAFISEYAHSVDKTEAPSDHNRRLIRQSVRRNSFFVRMARSYGWGRFSRIDLIPHYLVRLKRSVELGTKDKRSLFKMTSESIRSWNHDIQRLWSATRTVIEQFELDVRGSDLDRKLTDGLEFDSFMKQLAVFYLYGRLDQKQTEDMVNDHIPWLQIVSTKHGKPLGSSSPPDQPLAIRDKIGRLGVYHIEEANQDLLQQSMNFRMDYFDLMDVAQGANLSRKRPDGMTTAQCAYQLLVNASVRLWNDARIKIIQHMRDIGRCLAHGSAYWAATSKTKNDPIRILAIKDHVRQQNERARLDRQFAMAFAAAFRRDDVELDCFYGGEDPDNDETAWNRYEWWRSHVIGQKELRVHPKALRAQISSLQQFVASQIPCNEQDSLLEAAIKVFKRQKKGIASLRFQVNTLCSHTISMLSLQQALALCDSINAELRLDADRVLAPETIGLATDKLVEAIKDKYQVASIEPFLTELKKNMGASWPLESFRLVPQSIWTDEEVLSDFLQQIPETTTPLPYFLEEVRRDLPATHFISRFVLPDSTRNQAILTYDIILIEMEYRTIFAGVPIVQWLAMAFDELEKKEASISNPHSVKHPQIVALSRVETPANSYLCLSHGAEAFASKSRVFAIPSLLTYTQVGQSRVPSEPRNARPNFRALYGLLPETSNRLKSCRFDDLILGDEWDRKWLSSLPKSDLHFHMGTSVSLDTVNAISYNTTGYLLAGIPPDKNASSNLHRVLIVEVCKAVILLNLVINYQKHQAEGKHAMSVVRVPETFWSIARLIRRLPQGINVETSVLDDAIGCLTPKDRPFQVFETCSLIVSTLDVFAKAFEYQMDKSGASDEGPGLACILGEGDFRLFLRTHLIGSWSYFGIMAHLFDANGDPEVVDGSTLAKELRNVLDYLMSRVERNWKHAATRKEIHQLLQSAREMGIDGRVGWWSGMWKHVNDRVDTTIAEITKELKDLLDRPQWLDDEFGDFQLKAGKAEFNGADAKKLREFFRHHATKSFPGRSDVTMPYSPVFLSDLICIPTTLGEDGHVKYDERSLARYLWGAGLLGAEHLQFPENLFLSSFDIVRQNVQDNVVYSEIRCASNGYCKAGLSPQDATDLLCLGFDFAAAFFGWLSSERRRMYSQSVFQQWNGTEFSEMWEHVTSGPSQRWVRANLILGAKRHKKSEEFHEIVSLVRTYLDRGREPRPRVRVSEWNSHVENPGAWWDRCVVVGFDLSGDETLRLDDLRERIKPLFLVSAPITIHAGEAASAESIWDAVYSLGAARIGHGLRLRDDQRLLQYCSRRGICMELCPTSNLFTNIFREPHLADSLGHDGMGQQLVDDRMIYPLRAFLEAGLDVCLNTDNRFLHSHHTLTDEFLVAAKSVGGITRWEALKIIKAGFKCAFLKKPEIALMLQHVEYEVFKLVSDYDSDIEFRAPGHILLKEQSAKK